MIDWQIDTPIPMPPGLVVQNASKSRSKLSSFRPGPESCIAFVGFIACNLTPTYAVVVLMVVKLCKRAALPRHRTLRRGRGLS